MGSLRRIGLQGRYLALAIVLSASAAAAPAAGAGEGPPRAMKRLLVVAGGKAAHARAGSYCLRSGGATPGAAGVRECSSVAYDPHPRAVFRIAPGSTVAVCAGSAASRVRVATVRDSDGGPHELASSRAVRLDSSGQCWRAKLPGKLRGVSSLDILVTYGSAGYVHFAVGAAPG